MLIIEAAYRLFRFFGQIGYGAADLLVQIITARNCEHCKHWKGELGERNLPLEDRCRDCRFTIKKPGFERDSWIND